MSVKINKSLDDGLVLHVPMDEGSGSTGFDRSKNSHNAVVPSDIWEVDAEKGVVPHFNDLDSKNLDIPASTAFDLQEQTVSFWFKIDAINGLSLTVLGRWGWNDNWQVYRNNHNQDNQLLILRNYKNTSSSTTNLIQYYDGRQTGVWYHVCMVSHADGRYENYFNGVGSSNSAPVNFDEWNITTRKIFTNMQGYLKDVRIYNRALSESEISALYRLGVNKSLSDGLVFDVPLNEGSGSYAYDNSKYANNGLLVNSPSWVDGYIGKALQFGSTKAVSITDSDSLDVSSAITVFCRCKIASLTNAYSYLFIKSNAYLVHLVSSTSKGQFIPYLGGSSSYRVDFDLTDRLGEWLDLVMTYDSTTGYIKMYVNGELEDDLYVEGNLTISTNANNLNLSSTTSANSLDGTIDEFKVWNRALNETEIKQLYRLTQKGVE